MDMAGTLQNVAKELNSGKGTAGRLLKDETLYNNLNSTWSMQTTFWPRPTRARAGWA